ncbi:MAG: hypothetical protein GTN36_03955 [Candidatus Aenigmarchaeota archaeon]|nr:hypothetical protein [Candidatus Aenigmarchaeota archaeon]
MNFNLWIDSLTKPIPTFKKEKKNATLGEGALHIAVAGLISGFISGIYQMFFGAAFASYLSPFASAFAGPMIFLASLILTPIMAVIGWLILSGILYIFAMLFGGKGSYTTQSYLYAIYYAPLSIISSILVLIPIAGWILSFVLMIYGLYLLTMALKEVHNYTTGRALLTWLVPVGIVVLILFVLVGIAFMFLMGAFIGSGSMSGMFF